MLLPPEYPARGGTIMVKNGRYGAYVTIDGINATIPSDKTPETITLPEAIALIEERAAKGGGKPKRGAKKAAKPKATKAKADTSDTEAKPVKKKAAAKKAAPTKAAAKPRRRAT